MNKKLRAFSAMPTGILHEARVFKAGNSLAIRIPNAIAKHFELEDGTAVEIGADNSLLYIRKAPSSELQELIDRISPENVHAPVITNFVGNERW